VSQADLTMEGHSTGLVGERPFSIPTKKLAMWLFIIADTMTFAAWPMDFCVMEAPTGPAHSTASPTWRS